MLLFTIATCTVVGNVENLSTHPHDRNYFAIRCIPVLHSFCQHNGLMRSSILKICDGERSCLFVLSCTSRFLLLASLNRPPSGPGKTAWLPHVWGLGLDWCVCCFPRCWNSTLCCLLVPMWPLFPLAQPPVPLSTPTCSIQHWTQTNCHWINKSNCVVI